MIYRILGQPEVTIFMGKTMISQWILRRYPPSFLRDKATSVYFSTPVGVTVVIVWLLLGLHPQSIFFKHGFSRSIIASLAAKKITTTFMWSDFFLRLWWSCCSMGFQLLKNAPRQCASHAPCCNRNQLRLGSRLKILGFPPGWSQHDLPFWCSSTEVDRMMKKELL